MSRHAVELLSILICLQVACGGCGDPASSRSGSDTGSADAGSRDVALVDGDGADASGAPDFGTPGTPGEPWVDVSPRGRTPERRPGPEMAYDATQSILVTGAETWGWTGEVWERVADAPGPPNREEFALAYDAAREVVVMFGGWTRDGVTTFADTWTWDGTSWTEQAPAQSPPAVMAHQMVYEPAREQVVLYGGGGQAGLPRNEDTWAWDGSTWAKVDSADGTGPTSATAMVHDPSRGVSILYGGDFTLWEFDGVLWTQVDQGTTMPAGRGDPAMIYDPVDERVLFVGGQNAGTFYADTWVWDGQTWSDITSEVGALPGGRARHAAAFDSASGVLVYGGFGETGTIETQLFADTLLLQDGNWKEVSPDASPQPRTGASMAYDPVRGVTVLYGGVGASGGRYFRGTWTWDGEFWRRVVFDSAPGNRYNAAMAFDHARGEAVLFGGALNGPNNDTWTFDGQTWVEKSPANPPEVLTSLPTAMGWDGARDELLLHGDGVTWAWDGTDWTVRNESSPSGFYGHSAIVYDPVRQAPVLVGVRQPVGETQFVSATWTWDGSEWILVEDELPRPEPHNNTEAFWDSRRDSLVLFGGVNSRSSPLGDTWELQGSTWRDLTPEVSPSARQHHTMVFDTTRGRGLLFGGEGTEGMTWEWIGSAAIPAE